MEGVRTYRDLVAWQKARVLVREVYEVTRSFPDAERYGLTSQVRRASVSIMANIAEGSARRSGPDRAHFYQISCGSAAEVECLLQVSIDLGFLPDAEGSNLMEKAAEVVRMSRGLADKSRA